MGIFQWVEDGDFLNAEGAKDSQRAQKRKYQKNTKKNIEFEFKNINPALNLL
jgi:hypothetical protein